VIERFAQLNSIALIDTESGEQRELIQSGQRTITNPRLSPDRRWIAFDVSPAGGRASVFVAPFRRDAIAESDWIEVDRAASHPFWSADGRCLYYTPIGTNPLIRSAIRARRFDVAAGRVEGESIGVYTSNELLMPAYLPGTGAIATHDRILLVLGDFRGDLWIMNLDA
jgi:Tol biopolymer transport system component